MRRQWFSVAALIALAAVVVTGCGGSKSSSSSGTGKVSGSITVWAMGTEGDKLDVLAKDFMAKNPDVKVKVTPVAWEVAHDKILTSIAGNRTPDVSLIGTTWMAEFAQSGALDETPDSVDKSAFFPNAWDNVVVDGTPYGVPWYVETRVLYYRTDLAKKAGFTGKPESWDDVKRLAEGYKNKAGTRYGIALAPNNWQELLPFIWQAGGEVADDSGNFKLDDPATVKAISFDQSFFKNGLTAKTVPQGFDVTQGFIAGTHPMFFSGPWHIGLIKDQGGAEMNGKWDIAQMPMEQSRTSFLGGGDLAVFAKSKNKDAAWAFVRYLSRPNVQAKWFKTVADLPAVKAAWNQGTLATDHYLKVFRSQLDDAKPPPVLPKWEEVASKINDEMEKALVGGLSAQKAAKQMQQDAESVPQS